jgi:hypothetical protein
MKNKRLILNVAACAVTLCCVGQFSAVFPQDSHLGLKGGVSWGLFRNSGFLTDALKSAIPNVKPEPFFSWTASLSFTRDILKRIFATQLEIVYMRLGQSWDIGNGNHFQFRTDYVQFPLLFKFMVPVSQVAIPNVYIGPAIAFALRSRTQDLDKLPVQLESTSRFFSRFNIREPDWDYARNPVDVGFVTGLGVQIPAGPGTVELDLRYNHSALNVFNFNDSGKIRNYAFLVLVGYSL